MRFIALALAIMSLPAFIMWLRQYPAQRKWAYGAVGALPFIVNAFNLDAAIISWSMWLGYVKGAIITILDTLCIAILVNARQPFKKLSLMWPLIFFWAAATLSIAFAEVKMASAFYSFQWIRIIIVFAAVACMMRDRTAIRPLLMGLACGAIVQALYTIDQRIGGVVQASGTMGHQNLLGMMLHFVTLPLLGALLAGVRSKLIVTGVVAALVAVALGVSRGSIAFVAVGIVLTVALSLIRRATPHKWKLVGLGSLVLALLTPLVIVSFQERFEIRPVNETSDYDERAVFESAAKAMWSDNPMGVGANEYVAIANSRGYNERAGVTWAWTSRSANVHNLYLLTAAEMGWLGLIALLILFTWAIAQGIIFMFSHRTDPRGDVVLGATTAVIVTAVHSLYEWVWVTYQAQYTFAIALGVIAGCARQVQMERAMRRNAPYAQASPVNAAPVAMAKN